ncbi:hypothetical protein SAMN05216357_11940 [Porphyromonadaceae bacterium KH3CP3RA]|nr:hypothetical protein SAMN05216357_11940 [Porphyromonadaceae bacterium KH3CP3RA]
MSNTNVFDKRIQRKNLMNSLKKSNKKEKEKEGVIL